MYDEIETAGLKGRDFLSTQDWSVDELETLFSPGFWRIRPST